MTDWPNLCICLLTYDRLEYAQRTLRAALDNLSYSGRVSVHIADDGTGEEYRQSLFELAGGYEQVAGVSISNSERGGYGRNYNLAMQTIHNHCSIILPLEDDWQLLRPLNLDSLVQALADDRIGCIRLGYLGFTREYMAGGMISTSGAIYFLISPEADEPHVFSGHPRLETVEWERAVGPWPEGLDPNETEFAVCHNTAARQGVVFPVDLIHPYGNLFAHIGAYEAGEHRRYPKETVTA